LLMSPPPSLPLLKSLPLPVTVATAIVTFAALLD
jgi:hypothetical protein